MAVLNHIEKGQAAEEDAYAFLLNHGLIFVTRNYRCALGEVDLIMRDGDELVFIEVRFRTQTTFGSNAVDSVDYKKQGKLIKTANHYLSAKNLHDKVNCRFDVIGISYVQSKATFEWLKDAFSTDNL